MGDVIYVRPLLTTQNCTFLSDYSALCVWKHTASQTAAYDLGICILARDDPVAWNTFSYKFVIWVPPSSSKEKRQGGSSKIHRFTPREILRVTFPDGGMIQLTKIWKKLQFEETIYF